MKDKQFHLSVLGYIILIISWLSSIFVVFFFVSSSPNPMNWQAQWIVYLLIFTCLLSPCFIVTWSFLVEFTSSFSIDGIDRLSIFGRKRIPWNQIENIKSRLFFLDIKTSDAIYSIPLLMYADSIQLTNYIFDRFEEYSKGSEKKNNIS